MPHYPAADQFVGLTVDNAVALGRQQNLTVIVAVWDGACGPVLSAAYHDPVWVAEDKGVVTAARYMGWSGPPR